MVEVVRGDDPVNAVDRSDSPLTTVVARPDSPPASVGDRPGSPPTAVPLADFSWVDPSVVDFSSSYDTEKSVAKFLAKYPVLKACEDSDDSRDPDYFRILPCGPTERVCMDRANASPPFFYMYTCFFQIFMCPSLSTSSQWASFGRSTWRPPKCTQIRGRPFKHFVCCVTPCGFAPPFFFSLLLWFLPRSSSLLAPFGRAAGTCIVRPLCGLV